MKKFFFQLSLILTLSSSIFLNSCNSDKESVTPTKVEGISSAVNLLSENQIKEMTVMASKIANEELKKRQSSSSLREPYYYEYLATDITGMSGSCTFNLYSYVQPSAPGFANYFCAQPGHLRYGVIYFYDGQNMVAKGSIAGPRGGCISGGLNYSASNNFTGQNCFAMIVVFDVVLGPSNGPTFVNNFYSNSRVLNCNGPSY